MQVLVKGASEGSFFKKVELFDLLGEAAIEAIHGKGWNWALELGVRRKPRDQNTKPITLFFDVY